MLQQLYQINALSTLRNLYVLDMGVHFEVRLKQNARKKTYSYSYKNLFRPMPSDSHAWIGNVLIVDILSYGAWELFHNIRYELIHDVYDWRQRRFTMCLCRIIIKMTYLLISLCLCANTIYSIELPSWCDNV